MDVIKLLKAHNYFLQIISRVKYVFVSQVSVNFEISFFFKILYQLSHSSL